MKEKPEAMQESFSTRTKNLFKKNLRIQRAFIGLSGKELSIQLGFRSEKRINDLEDGRVDPTLNDLIVIVEYFQGGFDDLLFGEIILQLPTSRKL